MRGTTHFTVRNCNVHNCCGTGIFPAFSDYVVVENNVTHNNGEHGIYNCNSATTASTGTTPATATPATASSATPTSPPAATAS